MTPYIGGEARALLVGIADGQASGNPVLDVRHKTTLDAGGRFPRPVVTEVDFRPRVLIQTSIDCE